VGIPIYQIDAFADQPFRGNPAAVCLLSGPVDETWMQQVAQEMNLSETAFVSPAEEGFHLRWFTPAVEVDLCGHATLASAHALWESGSLDQSEPAIFQTRSGTLTADRKGPWIELNFPAEVERPLDASASPSPKDIGRALGTTPKYVGKNRFDYLVEVERNEMVKNLSPNFALLGEFPVRGVIVTSIADSSDYDFISRYFAPASGIDEDPVTGSAHCCLGPFWKGRLKKNDMTAYQASRRGGVVRVRVDGDRVVLGGKAVTILAGDLRDKM
jgi:PhzF family phenazine biosynthesis protein